MPRRVCQSHVRRSRRIAGLAVYSESIPEQSNSESANSRISSTLGQSESEAEHILTSDRSSSGVPNLSSVRSRFREHTLGEGTSRTVLRSGLPNSRLYSSSSSNSSSRDESQTTSSASSTSGVATSSSSGDRTTGSTGARGRRGVTGVHRRPGHGSVLRSYTEHLGAVPVQGESFCRCPQQGQSRDLHCECGEEDQFFEWTWDHRSKSAAAEVSESEREVRFHVNYSSGTAAVRGTQPMTDGQYFWEVKMTTPVYGTDMMVGVGTANVDVDAYRYNFCSILGRDAESWGLSYYGKAQARGAFTNITGARFGQGSVIGVHLDTWLGRVLFYKNRKPLGVVFTGLRGKTVYPMISSTAARTGMKLIKSCSCATTLQFLCCCALRQMVPPHLDVLTALHLPPGLRDFLINNVGWLLRPSELSAVTHDSRMKCKRSRRRAGCVVPRKSMRGESSTASVDSVEEDDEGVTAAKRSRLVMELADFQNDSSSSDSDEELGLAQSGKSGVA